MTKKDELRNMLLAELRRADRVQSAIAPFDALTLFDSKKNLNLESFYQNLETIVPWSELQRAQDSVHEITTTSTISKVIDILSWVFASWSAAVKEGDLERVVILFIVCERLFLRPEDDLNWDIDPEKLNRQLVSVLSKADVEIGVATHVRSSFTDKKFVTDYKEAVRLNDLRGIFEFFRAIDYSAGMWGESVQYIKILARIASSLDPGILPLEAAKFPALLMKVVVDAIGIEKVAEFTNRYVGESPLPLLICLRKVLSGRNGPLKAARDLDWDAIAQESKIVQAIAQRATVDGAVSYILDCLHLSLNKQNNATFATFVAGNPSCMEDYTSKVDFAYDDSGEASYAAMVQFANEATIDSLSVKIYKAFFDHIKKLDYTHHLFIFTSYCSYILRAIVVMSESSYSRYLEKLEQVSVAFLRAIHSWHPEQIPNFATEWIYWIMSSKFFARDVNADRSRLTRTYKLLDDRRLMTRLECTRGEIFVNFNWLRSFIEVPDDVDRITLPLLDKAIELSWTKAE